MQNPVDLTGTQPGVDRSDHRSDAGRGQVPNGEVDRRGQREGDHVAVAHASVSHLRAERIGTNQPTE
jgi:hypothetical protein